VAAAELETSRIFPQQMPLVVLKILLLLELTVPIIILIPFRMGFQVKNTGNDILTLIIFHFVAVGFFVSENTFSQRENRKIS
jgi:hypothetical protein